MRVTKHAVILLDDRLGSASGPDDVLDAHAHAIAQVTHVGVELPVTDGVRCAMVLGRGHVIAPVR